MKIGIRKPNIKKSIKVYHKTSFSILDLIKRIIK